MFVKVLYWPKINTKSLCIQDRNNLGSNLFVKVSHGQIMSRRWLYILDIHEPGSNLIVKGFDRADHK